ncbi:DUF1799 domain-containing protein [Nitratireductor rhodophyticola]
MDELGISRLKARLSGRQKPEFNGVWPANRAAMNAFLAAASQWRTTVFPEGGQLRTMWIGLDYAGATAAWERLGLDVPAETFAGVQVLEMAARTSLNGGEA